MPKLADAQKAQAEVMRKARELDDAKRELDLKVEEKVQASLAKVRSTASRTRRRRPSLRHDAMGVQAYPNLE